MEHFLACEHCCFSEIPWNYSPNYKHFVYERADDHKRPDLCPHLGANLQYCCTSSDSSGLPRTPLCGFWDAVRQNLVTAWQIIGWRIFIGRGLNKKTVFVEQGSDAKWRPVTRKGKSLCLPGAGCRASVLYDRWMSGYMFRLVMMGPKPQNRSNFRVQSNQFKGKK